MILIGYLEYSDFIKIGLLHYVYLFNSFEELFYLLPIYFNTLSSLLTNANGKIWNFINEIFEVTVVKDGGKSLTL